MRRAGAGLVVVILALALGGCSAPQRPIATEQVTRAPASVSSCLMPTTSLRAVNVGAIDVQLLGAGTDTGTRVVVISNQSDQDLCAWKDFAQTLVAQGDEVALFDYVGAPQDNAASIATWMRAHGASRVALLGGSQGAKASIIAAASMHTPPDALIALSGEQYLEGEDVADSAANLHCPTLFLTADHDPFDSTSANQQFHQVAPSGVSTLTVVPGTDHGIQLLSHPDVHFEVLAFLAAHLGTTS